jgi:Pectate lyase superfamily protein
MIPFANLVQSNFLRQVRNLLIDIEDLPASLEHPAGIHWQVAQGTSLENLQIHGSSKQDTNQVGICRAFSLSNTPQTLRTTLIVNPS